MKRTANVPTCHLLAGSFLCMPGGDAVQPTFPLLCPACGEVVAPRQRNSTTWPTPIRESTSLPDRPAGRRTSARRSRGLRDTRTGRARRPRHRFQGGPPEAWSPRGPEDGPVGASRPRRRPDCERVLWRRSNSSIPTSCGSSTLASGWIWEAQEFMDGGDLARSCARPAPPRRAVKLLAPVTSPCSTSTSTASSTAISSRERCSDR